MAKIHYGNFITFTGSRKTADKLMNERVQTIKTEKSKPAKKPAPKA